MGDNTLDIRHYIYGVSGDTEEFLTTKLSVEGAEKFARDHMALFSHRYSRYSIKMNASKEVLSVENTGGR